MERIKLNPDFGKSVVAHGYELEPTKMYVVNLGEEMQQQQSIMSAVHAMGLEAMKDWHTWLKDNGFNQQMPNPTNDFVSEYYGSKVLWETALSRGVVVKAEDEDDFYIVMECSRVC